MSVHIVWNTLKDPQRRGLLQAAVLDAIKHHGEDGSWHVKLTACGALPGWTAVIVAPDQTKIAWHFQAHEDQPADRVRQRIELLLRAAGLVH
jgi:hypothetical protein